MTAGGAALRGALASATRPIVVPECYSALTARLVEAEGFLAAFVGGYTMAGTYRALPDQGLLAPSELVELARPIAEQVAIPVIVDVDHGGATDVQVGRTIRDLVRIGAGGLQIEDVAQPKHTADGDRLLDVDEMCRRVQAAAHARADDDLVIIARTDVLALGGSIGEAIERGKRYAAAGADLFMPFKMTTAQIDAIAEAVSIPLVGIGHPVTEASTTRLGLDLFLQSARVAGHAHRQFLRKLRDDGLAIGPSDPALTPAEYAALLDTATGP